MPSSQTLTCVLTLWALLPVLFWRSFFRTDASNESAGFRELRQTAKKLLADRGFASQRARYSVPFYLVVGAPGSGKSSLLDKSELKLTRPAKIGAANWWISKDAVFIETSLGKGEAALRETCDVIKSLRPLQPLNGIILTVSPGDLTLADMTEQRDIAQSTARELRLIEDATGGPLPVYLALSKIDLLPGFLEFFDRQEQQERQQGWGFALPYRGLGKLPDNDNLDDAMANGFDGLLAAIRSRLVEWLSRETDATRGNKINGFGTQIASIQQTLRPLLAAMQSDAEERARSYNLRGVYLTSAHQEALSIDGLLPELSRRFAMPRIGMLPPDLGLDDEDHGFFIGGVFKQAVFREAGLANRGTSTGAIAQWASVAAIVAASLGASYLVFTIFDGEIRRSARAAEIADTMRPMPPQISLASLPTILATMQTLEGMKRSGVGVAKPSIDMPGLNRGEKIARAAEQSLAGLRRNALAPSIAAMLENELVEMDADLPTLRARIALAENPSAPEAGLADWISKGATTLPEQYQDYFAKEGLALFETDGAIVIDPAYLDTARRIIAWKESLS
jgi:type VI protein secretion system component VasK